MEFPSRRFDVLFVVLIVINVLPLWIWTYFPSQDGPSHLYNAVVLANIHKEPIYQEYYRLSVSPAGNLLTQFVLAGLLKFLPGLFAEKVLLTLYVVTVPISFRYFLAEFGQEAQAFSFFSFVFIYNYFLHLGFWNFCFSFPLALFALGFFMRHRHNLTPGNLTVFGLLAMATYSAHIASWGVLVMTVGWLVASELLSYAFRRFRANSGEMAGEWNFGGVTYLLASLVPGILVGLFLAGGNAHFVFQTRSLPTRVWVVYSLSFLDSWPEAELWILKILAAIVAALIGYVFFTRLFRQRRLLWNSFLGLAVVLTVIAVFGPQSYGTGDYISERVALFSFAFLIFGLAATGLFRGLSPAICIVISCLSVGGIVSRRAPYSNWNVQLSEYSQVERQISPNSTVLSVILRHTPEARIAPGLHAVDFLAPKPFVDLRNYEAGQGYFPVQFRPERTPFNSLGTITSLESSKPSINCEGFTRVTGGRVDYILVEGTESESRSFPEPGRPAEGCPGFKLVYVSPNSNTLRLYRNANFRAAE